MATLEELYQTVMADEGERAAFVKAAADEATVAEFLAAHGCDATTQEARAFLEEKFSQTGEIAGEELGNVSGGGCLDSDGPSFFPL